MDIPIIGITTYGRDENGRFPLPAPYVDAVRRAGGIGVLLPPGEYRIRELVALVDGLVLAGGGDIDPATYGGTPHPDVYMVDSERDRMELALAESVIANGMPTLAICRGSQVINIVEGGTLYEHIPDIYGESVKHRLPPREPVPHPIKATAESLVSRVMETTECAPVSWHHQAIRDVAPSLRGVAHAPDGVIEALEMSGHPWLVAVQWHPEETAAEDPTQQRLFNALIAVAREARAS